jgi:methylated-DNA-[protein]-cysteine S-methyltransferase
LLIPCHRVVAKNGLGGFMQGVDGGLKIKEWLLAYESK